MRSSLLALLVACISASRIIWFMPGMGNGYYFLLTAVLFFLLSKEKVKNLKMEAIGGILLLACALSIMLNYIPDFYRPWMRLGLFSTVVFLVGPFLQSPIFRIFRKVFFKYQLWLYVIIALLSFLGRFVGISHVQGNYWCGITNHSMIMGIVAGNAGVYLLMLMTCIDSLTSKQRWNIGVILVLCLLMMLGAASRSSILAFITGGTVTLLVSMKQHRIRILKIAVVAIVVLYFLTPFLTQYTIGIQQKNNGDIIALDVKSRSNLWEKTWQTFRDNPWVGIGFSAMEIDTGEIFTNHTQNGQVEPGSSWLAVLSMTGLLGGIAIVLVLKRGIFQLNTIYKSNIPVAAILYGLLAFYFVHMCAEGYIFAGGSMSCLNFWLLLGTIDAYATDDRLLQEEQYTEGMIGDFLITSQSHLKRLQETRN